MPRPCLPPSPDPTPPRFALPDGATDCHVHLFSRDGHASLVAERDYTPAEAEADALRRLHDTLGIARFVVVQPSVYGDNNDVQLRQAAAVGLPFRAVVVPRPDTTEAEMRRLHEAGVRAVRYILAHPGGLDLRGLERSADRARAFGWHLEFLLRPEQLVELAPRLRALSCPVSCDHLALVRPGLGLDQPAWTELARLLDTGRGWVKLSGAYRVAGRAERYEPVLPFARSLVEAYGERLVWGSDWPHVGQFEAMPDTTRLLDVLADWAPDPEQRRRILVTNPGVLYGFDEQACSPPGGSARATGGTGDDQA